MLCYITLYNVILYCFLLYYVILYHIMLYIALVSKLGSALGNRERPQGDRERPLEDRERPQGDCKEFRGAPRSFLVQLLSFQGTLSQKYLVGDCYVKQLEEFVNHKTRIN